MPFSYISFIDSPLFLTNYNITLTFGGSHDSQTNLIQGPCLSYRDLASTKLHHSPCNYPSHFLPKRICGWFSFSWKGAKTFISHFSCVKCILISIYFMFLYFFLCLYSLLYFLIWITSFPYQINIVLSI